MTLTITSNTNHAAQSVAVHVAGDLDYGSTDELLDAVSQLVRDDPTLRELRFDFGDLTFCDSAGLAVLLQIHRITSAAGIQLHLDDRPGYLDRILEVTGVLDFLTSPPKADALQRRTSAIQPGRHVAADASVDGVRK